MPPLNNGLQRTNRFKASQLPLTEPYFLMAS